MTAVAEISGKQGFHPGPGGAFNYDAAGNMTGVGNKGSTVVFNGLNLPQSATFTAGASMAWTYAADGRKLLHSGPDGTRQYADGIEVRNGKKDIYFPDGRAYLNEDESAWVYEYALKDHLGNARVVIADINLNGTIDTHPDSLEILQENHYYPFGMNHEGEWIRQLDPINSYMYNGKEFTEDSLDIDGDGKLEMALDCLPDVAFAKSGYDYGARMNDPTIARFTGVDPLADIAPHMTPYHYVSNNPINRIDPDGLTDFTVNKETGEITQVGEANDDPDRILRTNRKGEVKYRKNGEAKVAIDDISKGILEDGLNLQENDVTFEVNGEGQPTLGEFNSFISEFSDYVGREIAGIRLGKADSEQVLKVKTHKYKNSTKVESQTPRSWLTRYGAFLKGHFHTHPYHDHTPSEKDQRLKSEYPDILFYIIAGGHEKKF